MIRLALFAVFAFTVVAVCIRAAGTQAAPVLGSLVVLVAVVLVVRDGRTG